MSFVSEFIQRRPCRGKEVSSHLYSELFLPAQAVIAK